MMIDAYRRATINQYESAFSMLDSCVDRCPDTLWNEAVANHKFCQVVFHALFFADLYLGQSLDSLRSQSFHRENPDLFRDYEQLQDRAPRMIYQKEEIRVYGGHCRSKAIEVVSAETPESLDLPSGFDWLEFSRAELHPYNIRHVQHHVGQLCLRLRLDTGDGTTWVKTGWNA